MLFCSGFTTTAPPVSCGKGGRRRTTTLTRSAQTSTKHCSVVTASFCPKVDLRHTALTLCIKATSGSARGLLTRCKIGAGFSVQPVAVWARSIRLCRTGSECSDVSTNILCSFQWWNVLRHSKVAQRWYPRMLVYQSSWQRLNDQVSPDLLKTKASALLLNRKIVQHCIARLHRESCGDRAAHRSLDRYHSSQNHTHGIRNHTCRMPMHARMSRPRGSCVGILSGKMNKSIASRPA